MSNISKLTALFAQQVGVKEIPPGSNNVKYNTDYYGRPVSGDDFKWCLVFIWDIFRLAGISQLFFGGAKSAYCPWAVDWAKTHNCWVTSGYREGDIVFFDWDGDGKADHVEYATGAVGNTVMTVGGNVSDEVKRMTRTLPEIMGAYRPDYGKLDTGAATSDTSPPQGGTYTVKTGDTLSGIAAAYGITYQALAAHNGIIDPNRIFVGQVIKIPDTKESDARENDAPAEYIVQPGDTLWAISMKFYGDVTHIPIIQSLNKISTSWIYPGQKLKLP